MAQRYIGIQHRVKQTKAGEARPTLVVIRDCTDKKVRAQTITLDDEQSELDFVRGKLPTQYREVTPDDKIGDFPFHHIKWRNTEEGADTLVHQTQKVAGKLKCMHKVPTAYEGLRAGDTVGMILGGSGDYLAMGLAAQGTTVGATVFRIPTNKLRHYRARRTFAEHDPVASEKFETLLYKTDRTETEQAEFEELKTFFNALQVKGKHKDVEDTSRDAELLAQLVQTKQRRFYKVEQRDKATIVVRECNQARLEAMRARIACGQRLEQFARGKVFREAGLNDSESIAAAFDAIKANDGVYQELVKSETAADRALAKALKEIPFYEHLATLESKTIGLGPAIMARIFSAVIDIRRFSSASKCIAFAGVHVLPDGRFARRRSGEVANWHGDLRQALYLLADQWVRRPDSFWGKKLKENKVRFRAKHPEVITDPDTKKKKYTDGHIHKMGIWRTITQFLKWFYGEWSRFERGASEKKPAEQQQKVA